MATHRAVKTRYRDTAPPGLAITALVLGAVGFAFAFLAPVNTVTGWGAAVGVAVGLVGIWRSRQILSGVAVVLCGTAVILTLLAIKVQDVELERRADLEFHLDLPLPEAPAKLGVSRGC